MNLFTYLLPNNLHYFFLSIKSMFLISSKICKEYREY